MKKLTLAGLALCMASLTGCSSSDEDELVLPRLPTNLKRKCCGRNCGRWCRALFFSFTARCL